ncbi:MAG: hypothetical protein AW12_02272 [Candidatus Accumulibacter sp. BA-94]|nr:MAG: hypothetical protein AW12_02272 [Candidatus Accumulibacter sp. BA-94]
MKAPVVWSAVLALAARAHREGLEAGARAVVGQAAADRVARPTVRAIGEGMPPAAAGGVEHLGQAVTADGRVMADHRRRPTAAAVDDDETVAGTCRRRLARHHRIDPRQWRRLLLQTLDETLYLFRRAAHFDLDATRIVAHPAGKTQFPRQTPDEGAKTDSLNDTADADVLANHRFRHVSTSRRWTAGSRVRRRGEAGRRSSSSGSVAPRHNPRRATPASRRSPRRWSPRAGSPATPD